MFKFFRRIRLSLIKKDNLRKYLLYAVGEILLVVIGILIALQVNNWNQNKIYKQMERTYLKNLIINMETDLRLMDRLVIDRYDKKMEGLKLAKAYNMGTYQVQDTLDFLTKAAYGAVFAQGINFFSLQTYNELVSTGNLQLIRDDELKTSINNYYRFVQSQIVNVSQYTTDYIHLINGLRPFDEADPGYISPSDQKIMMQGMQSKELLRAINQELTFGSRVYTLLQPSRKITTELIEKIKLYLKE